MDDDGNKNVTKDVWIGFAFYIVLWVAALVLISFLGFPCIFLWPAGTIGLGVWAAVNKRPGIIKGLVIAFALSLLLMAACFGVVFWLFRS